MERRGALILGSLLACGILAVVMMTWRKKKRPTPPKFHDGLRWRPIGSLKHALLFPMKSAAYIDVEEVECTEMGPAQIRQPGFFTLRDRMFIVYREDTKEIMLCMTYPVMVSIKVEALSEDSVVFKKEGKDDLIVPIPSTVNISTDKAEMWTKEKMDYLDCGEEAADWFTEIIKGDKKAQGRLKLGYWAYPKDWSSGSDENYNFRGAYQNYSSYMIMTSASLADLSGRLPEHPLTFRQFRPNFLVQTDLGPFAEDNWTWVRIGEEAVFWKKQDCARCSQININPETAKFNKKQEPLMELVRYRHKIKSEGPHMGICMGLYKAGKVKVGDPVYIAV